MITRSSMAARHDGAFTLVELMTVVTILGIGIALAVPNYVRWNARYALRSATTQTQSQLSLARLMATNRNTSVTVTLSFTAGRVTVQTVDSTGTQILPTESLSNHISAVSGGPVTFSSLGLRSGGGAGSQIVTLTNDQGLTYSVRILPSGKATWCPNAVPNCAGSV